MEYDVVVIGGGAAGFFSALSVKSHFPQAQVALLEKTNTLLAKVKISGGGRCNVTHSCFDPKELCKNYPRGQKELLGPFYSFGPQDTLEWFSKKGVKITAEADGRMFPITNSSQTIIDCFLSEAKALNVEIKLKHKIENIVKDQDQFCIHLKSGDKIVADKIIVATGSNSFGFEIAKSFSHNIEKPIPSLFTFNIEDFDLKHLSGLSVQNAKVMIDQTNYKFLGPVLITHFGFSGPCVLKLSAFAAKEFYEAKYQIKVNINWLGEVSQEEVFNFLKELKSKSSDKGLFSLNPYKLPKKLWKHFLQDSLQDKKLSSISLKALKLLSQKLCFDTYQVLGKTTNKEEFVTCGGISLKEVNFKTMESKKVKGLFFAGEILDIDGITGGFNFQNAWTTGFIAGKSSLTGKDST